MQLLSCCAVFLTISLTACDERRQPLEDLAPRMTPLPQDPLVQVYFNQSESSSYKEFYREQSRYGDNFEQLIADAIAGASSTVDVAVQEFRLPVIARVMAQKQGAGVKVRAIVENNYSRPWSNLTTDEIGQLSERERDRYNEFLQLADTDKNEKISQEEMNQGDALVILRNAGIPIIDDTADGSKGSNLMHHKFAIVDGKTLIVTSANFTPSDIHGDFKSPLSRGNANNLLKIESVELAQIFTQEFNIMWGDGPEGKPDSKFGVKKPLRSVQNLQVGDVKIAVQFSPVAKSVPWEQSSNGLISKTLESARKSVNLALFVFSAQRLANVLERDSLRGVEVKALIDPNFAYRSYSEALDMMGVAWLENCKVEPENRPWQKPIQTIKVPSLLEGDRLHHKFGVIDGKVVITGSHNWSEAANYGNDETLLVLENERVGAQFEREFERLYQGAVSGLPSAIAQKIQADNQSCQPKSLAKPNVNSSPQKLINLNTATQAELETLPGMGPKLAQRIILARKQQPFTSLEDLDRVSGIGKSTLDRWRDRVTW
ncbi:competence protein ComE [Oscillatoriales cyanobacterium USR001]|nr:competence protein ComE [Oscillatoriales cyanobacterium USR001]